MNLDVSPIAEAIWSGMFRLYGVDVYCHTLSDGRRIIEESSFCALIEAMHNPDVDVDLDTLHAFADWQMGR